MKVLINRTTTANYDKLVDKTNQQTYPPCGCTWEVEAASGHHCPSTRHCYHYTGMSKQGDLWTTMQFSIKTVCSKSTYITSNGTVLQIVTTKRMFTAKPGNTLLWRRRRRRRRRPVFSDPCAPGNTQQLWNTNVAGQYKYYAFQNQSNSRRDCLRQKRSVLLVEMQTTRGIPEVLQARL